MAKYLFALAVSAAIAVPAIAGTEAAPVQVAVSHVDLDLNVAPGRKTLDGRLRRAAAVVCPAYYRFSVLAKLQARACQKRALIAARREAAVAAVKAQGQLAAR